MIDDTVIYSDNLFLVMALLMIDYGIIDDWFDHVSDNWYYW